MVGRELRIVVGWALLLGFSAATVYADCGGNAMMYSSGVVTINGSSASGTAAVFVGDKITTADNSVARLSTARSTIVVVSKTALTYGGTSVELNGGTVEITTSNSIHAKAAGLTIAPAENGTARFQIALSACQVAIVAVRGSVLVSDGRISTVMQEGNQRTNSVAGQKADKKKGAGELSSPCRDALGGRAKAGLAGLMTGLMVTAIKTTGPPASNHCR